MHRKVAASVTLLACTSFAWTALADDVTTVKTRMFQFQSFSLPGIDFTNPGVKAAAASILSQANSAAATIAPKTQKCADGSTRQGTWPDIDYCDVGAGAGWQPANHFSRLHVLAQAYRMPAPGSMSYGNATLRGQIESALSVIPTFYTAAICQAQVHPPAGTPAMNWWWCEIGAPSDLAPTLLLMEGAVDPTVFANAQATLVGNDCLDAPWSAPPFNCPSYPLLTGANLTDVASVRMYYATYAPSGVDRAAMLQSVEGAVAYATEPDPTTHEGIQDDAAFLQHGPQLYTGGYGDVFATDLAR
jgi:chondroitin AC lyase